MTRTGSHSSRRDGASGDLFDSALASPSAHRSRQALPWPAAALVAALVGILLWGAWVTKMLLVPAAPSPAFAAVRLQPLVAEYVEAQARSARPEGEVAQETRAFMARLDAELQRRGRAGTTILVAEAVLSKDVPDITAEVRRAVLTGPSRPGATTNPGGAVVVAR